MAIDGAALRAAFGLAPEEAIAFLENKGLVPTKSWRDLEGPTHARAFTVARSAGFDVLGDIRDALVQAQREGLPYREFAKRLTPVLQAKGWWGKAVDQSTGEIDPVTKDGRPAELGSPRRLKTIYQTNLQQAYMKGRGDQLAEAIETHPYVRYSAVLDSRTRPRHRALHGKIFRQDGPEWGVIAPVNGFRCRCTSVPVSTWRLEKKGWEVSNGEVLEQIDGLGRPRKGVRFPDGETFWPDAGFDYNPSREAHAALGQRLLNRAETAAPRLAAVAVRQTLSQPALKADIARQFAGWAENLTQARGELRHVGALSIQTLSALERRNLAPETALLSVRDADVLHTHRDSKAGKLPWAWYKGLPAHLLAPRAVLLEKGASPPVLLMVFDTPDGVGKLVVRVDYRVAARNGAFKANIIGTGKIMDANALLDPVKYEALEGALK